MTMKQHGIERQTLLVAMIPILFLAVLLEGYFTYSRFADLDRALLDRSKLISRQLAESSEYAMFSGNTALLQQQVNQAFLQQDVNSIIALDANLKFLVGAGDTKNLYDNGAYELQSDRVSEFIPLKQNSEALWIYQPVLATQIQLNENENAHSVGKPIGSITVEISKRRLNSQKIDMLAFNFLLTIAVLLATFLLSIRVSRSVTSPIMGMSRAIRQLGEGKLDTRISPQPYVIELSDLAIGINRMAKQLQQDRDLLQHRIDDATKELSLKKDEAERLNFDKTRFLAAASHDLRQPMHALGLFVGELNNKLTTNEQHKVAGKIQESVEAMSGLLDSLLDISKLDAGIVVPQFQEFSIAGLLTRIYQDFSPVADNKKIKFRVPKCSSVIVSDPVLLERILLNLLSNALRYTHIGGSVIVTCRKRGDMLRIEVRDNGIGIPPSEHKNIYREFIQLANRERDRSKGLGLGLAIVERLSKLLTHSLSLRSALNKGSVFSIDVPLVDRSIDRIISEQSVDEIEQSSVDRNLGGSRVLVVDDDSLVRSSTAGLLMSWGCDVSVASTLGEVKDKFSDAPINLIICDFRLPDGNGIDVVRHIQSVSKTMPAFILISGDTAPDILQLASEHRLHLLHKPVRPAKLRSMAIFLLGSQGGD